MNKLRKLTLVALIFGFAGLAGADTLDMQGADAKSKVGPASGSTQESVEASFGAPIAKKAPVGDPPISSWEYEGFVVFFEHDRVIHSVKKR